MVPGLLIAALSNGCSLSLQGPDPLRSAHVAPTCDTGKGPVAADWVFAGIAATIALTALGEDAGEVAAISALTSVAFIASAARGNGVVNNCREDFAAYSPPPPENENDNVARRPRRPGPAVAPKSFEDPYADPGDLPARRVVAKPAATATAPSTVSIPVPAPTAPPPAKPAPTKPPPVADDWSDFWTEVP